LTFTERFISSTITPFETKFAPIIANIQRHGETVENEVRMAHAKDQRAENDLRRSFEQNIETKQSDQMSREVRLWLQPSNSANNLRKLRETRTVDTCTWLLSKEPYTSWTNSTKSNILWLHGIPGGGKSVLASYVIDNLHLKNIEPALQAPVVYFFCSGRNENQRTSIHILRSLVSQLQAQNPDLADLVADAYKSSASRVADSFDELWALFRRMCEMISVICVIDGLDECQQRDEDGTLDRSTFAHNLVKLANESRSDSARDSYLKILLTSRNEPDLRIAFQSAGDIVQTLCISSTDVSNDIRIFITNGISRSEVLNELSGDMKVNVINRLDENASGMFIWARLMIEQLEATESDEALEEALRTIPKGLSALYDRVLTSVTQNFERSDSVRDLGCFILCWVVHGTRPLTLTELAEARCVKLDESSLSLSKKPRSLVTFRRLIELACAPLVEVQDDGLIQLVHHTTKEYLLSISEQLFDICKPLKTFGVAASGASDIHYILSLVCLSYLSLEKFELPLLGVRKRFALKSTVDVRNLHPFLEYAAGSFLFHVSHSQKSPYALLHRFVQTPQAITWIEATITLLGSVEKLATTIGFLPMFSTTPHNGTTETSAVGLDEGSAAVIEWFESLQQVIFDWGGTLNQTPSEIHFLDVLGSTARCFPLGPKGLQKFALLEDPTMAQIKVRPLEEGARFLLRHPYVYVCDGPTTFIKPFLRRYHWLSMQEMGELMIPRIEGALGRVVDLQICPNQRFISVVLVGAQKIMIAVWSLSDEGFDPLPWADDKSIIGSISTNQIIYDFSHLVTFGGPGWRRSGRHTAFSEDGKTIWTPAGAFDLATGKNSDIPRCCGDPDVTHSTWSFYGQRIACIRGKKTLEVYENDGKSVAACNISQIENPIIVDFSKSGRYVLLLQPQTWRHFIYDIHLLSLSTIPTPTFSSNPLELEIANYYENGSIVSHSFSPCERYISFFLDSINHQQPAPLGIWDRQTENWTYAQIFSAEGRGTSFRPYGVQFDSARSETLHLLVDSGGHGRRKESHGFIEIDIKDSRFFRVLQQSRKQVLDFRFDLCLNETGGRVFQRIMYSLYIADGVEEKVDMIVWDLTKAPPEIQCRFTVPRERRKSRWREGHSQSNGGYGDSYALLNVSSKYSHFIFLLTFIPTSIRQFSLLVVDYILSPMRKANLPPWFAHSTLGRHGSSLVENLSHLKRV
jgi:hypothetical protein